MSVVDWIMYILGGWCIFIYLTIFLMEFFSSSKLVLIDTIFFSMANCILWTYAMTVMMGGWIGEKIFGWDNRSDNEC